MVCVHNKPSLSMIVTVVSVLPVLRLSPTVFRVRDTVNCSSHSTSVSSSIISDKHSVSLLLLPDVKVKVVDDDVIL